MSDTAMNDRFPQQNPAALSTSARAGMGIKHIAGKALKYSVIAGVTGAGLCALAPALVLVPIALGLGVFSGTAAAAAMGPVAAAALTGAKVGGIGGALLGGAV